MCVTVVTPVQARSNNRNLIQCRGWRSCMARIAFIGSTCRGDFAAARACGGDSTVIREGNRLRLNDDGARRPVARALEMKARSVPASFAAPRPAPKRGEPDQATQASAAEPASRSLEQRCWRRSDSNHRRRLLMLARRRLRLGRRGGRNLVRIGVGKRRQPEVVPMHVAEGKDHLHRERK